MRFIKKSYISFRNKKNNKYTRRILFILYFFILRLFLFSFFFQSLFHKSEEKRPSALSHLFFLLYIFTILCDFVRLLTLNKCKFIKRSLFFNIFSFIFSIIFSLSTAVLKLYIYLGMTLNFLYCCTLYLCVYIYNWIYCDCNNIIFCFFILFISLSLLFTHLSLLLKVLYMYIMTYANITWHTHIQKLNWNIERINIYKF